MILRKEARKVARATVADMAHTEPIGSGRPDSMGHIRRDTYRPAAPSHLTPYGVAVVVGAILAAAGVLQWFLSR